MSTDEMINVKIKLKKICFTCGYWNTSVKQSYKKYKCYTNRCPAKQRDNSTTGALFQTTIKETL